MIEEQVYSQYRIGEKMNKIGLIGGTGPESTMMYYHDIVYGVQDRLGKAFFPNLTIESLSVFDVLHFCEKQDYDGLTRYLSKGFQNLANTGVQYGALTGITPHIVFEELAKHSPIPLISMVDTACNYAKKQEYQKIGLLGTLPTMDGTFFQKIFAENGIEVLTPTEDEKRYIGSKIETELEYGKILSSTQDRFSEIAKRMITQDKIQAIVLGCTELPLIFKTIQLSVPYIDVMRIHVNALIDTILEN